MAKYLQRRRRQRRRSPSASDALCVKCWLACPRLRSLQGEWHIKLILVWWGCGRAWLQPLCITRFENISELRCRKKKERKFVAKFFFCKSSIYFCPGVLVPWEVSVRVYSCHGETAFHLSSRTRRSTKHPYLRADAACKRNPWAGCLYQKWQSALVRRPSINIWSSLLLLEFGLKLSSCVLIFLLARHRTEKREPGVICKMCKILLPNLPFARCGILKSYVWCILAKLATR